MKIVTLILILFAMTGCSTLPNLKGKQGIGTVLGSGAGSYIGYQFAEGLGAAGGTLFGGYLGYNLIGLFNDKRETANKAFQKTLEYNSYGVSTTWQNSFDNTSGMYVPIATFQRPDGAYCREVSEVVRVNSRTYQNEVTACRNENGVWELM